MDELLREHGWYLVWALTVVAAWLHGNNRATDEHIASLEQHLDWLRAHNDEGNAAIDAILDKGDSILKSTRETASAQPVEEK
jgi:hypothetical protein